MEKARETALQRAIALLKAAGVAYAIITPDGVKFGELEVVERRTTTRKKTGIDYQAIYRPVIQDMPAGDCRRIKVPDHIPLENMRSAVSAWCSNVWGAGNHITAVDEAKREVEVLRVG